MSDYLTWTPSDALEAAGASVPSFDLPTFSTTATAYGVPQAGAAGTIDADWLDAAIARFSDLTWNNLAGKPTTFPPGAHAHAASDITSGTLAISRLPVAPSNSFSATEVVRADDGRLANARTPLAHTHPATDITSGTLADARLSANIARLNTAQTWSAAQTFDANAALSDSKLLLRDATDLNNALCWLLNFGGVSIDGPVLHGYAAGAVGTVVGAEKVALRWDSDQITHFYGKASLRDNLLLLRNSTDLNHALGWLLNFGGVAIDGPVLHGFAGGGFGSKQGGDKVALRWDQNQNVYCYNDINAVTFSTTTGNKWKLQGYTAGALTPLGYVTVNIDGTARRLLVG